MGQLYEIHLFVATAGMVVMCLIAIICLVLFVRWYWLYADGPEDEVPAKEAEKTRLEMELEAAKQSIHDDILTYETIGRIAEEAARVHLAGQASRWQQNQAQDAEYVEVIDAEP